MVKILDCEITREGYTRHGQHLNATGKTKLAQLTVQNLTKPSKNKNINPIPLEWKMSTIDLIPIEQASSGLKKVTRKPDSVTNEVNQSTPKNQNIRTLCRRKKIPATRRDDFYGINPTKVPNNFINKLTHRPQISDENVSNEGTNNSNTLLRTNSHSTTPLDKNNQYVHKEYNNKKNNVSSRTGCTTSSQPIHRTNSTQSPNTQSLCTNKACTWSNKTPSNNKNTNTNNTDELRIYHQNIRGLHNNKIN